MEEVRECWCDVGQGILFLEQAVFPAWLTPMQPGVWDQRGGLAPQLNNTRWEEDNLSVLVLLVHFASKKASD